MKVLIITYHFPPYSCIGAVRTGKTAQKLLEMGCDVRVISAGQQRLPSNLDIGFPRNRVIYTNWYEVDAPLYFIFGEKKVTGLKESLGEKTLKTRIILHLKKLYSKIFHIPDKYIGWYFPALNEASRMIKLEGKPDVIFSSASPYTSHLVAKNISKTFDIPWVAELRDLWSDNHYRNTSFMDKWIEKKTLSGASALVTVSNPLAEKLASKYNLPIKVIQNGFDLEDFISIKNNRVENNILKIVYTGNVYEGKRDPRILLEVLAADINLQLKISLDFYGPGMGWVDELISSYGLNNCVKTHPPVSREKALLIQKNSDLLLLLTWNDPKEQGVFTGKLFEYIGTGNAILSIGATDDVASKVIVEESFGIATNNPSDIAQFILNFKKGEFNASQEKRLKYERTEQVERLFVLLKQVTQRDDLSL